MIVLATWRFASRLTASLSLEGPAAQPAKPAIYGVERVKLEAWERENSEERPTSRSTVPANPGAAVARLAVGGLFVFALGEPFLLSGPPAIGEHALAAMIVFLFATGIVLSASSGVGTLRRVRAAGGQVSANVIPGRMATAALVMVTILALALAMPGLEVRGSGARRPAAADDGTAGGEERGEATEGPETEASADAQEGPEDRSRDRRSTADAPAVPALTGFLAELGRWLRIPVLLAVAGLVVYVLWRQRSRLGKLRRRLADRLRDLVARLRDLVARLAAGLRGLFKRRPKGGETCADPLADLDALRQAEPRQAVLAAYGRLIAAFDQLDHRRAERQTPYEFLASIPTRLEPLAGPARELTDVYVKAAYSAVPVAAADRRQAIAALEELGRGLE